MKIKLDAGAYPPERKHETDAGLDICANCTKIIRPHSSAVFHTGVHVQLPNGTAGLLVSRSGLYVKNDITSTGLIDEGYSGEILVKLTNHGDKSHLINAGDRISQLVIIPVLYESVELVDELNQDSERGDNGFGSTGM